MRRIVIAALLAVLSNSAFALCPAVLTDCPFPVFRSLTLGGNLNMGDNLSIIMSSDATKTLSFQSSPNAVVLTNVILQPNLGVQIPAGQPLILNSASGTAIINYDTSLNRVRLQNVPFQIDGALYMPGGNITLAGALSVGNGILVNGAYSGTTDPALSFAGATFAAGAPALILGDNSLLQLSTANTGFALAASTATNSVNLTYNGATQFSVDNSGNVTINGHLNQSTAFQGLQTFTAGLTVSGGTATFAGPVIGNGTNTFASIAVGDGGSGEADISVAGTGNLFMKMGATALFRVAANNVSVIDALGNGDILLNSASTLATNATAGFLHIPSTTAAPTGTPANTTPGCEWNKGTHTMNCYDGAAWYHATWVSGAL